MEEKKITEKEFDEAVAKVSADLANEEKLSGISNVIMIMIGMIFASKMDEILFKKEEEKDDYH